jgi:hypothetical protein
VALSARGPLVVLGLVTAGLVAVALTFDFSTRSGGRFWSDGATYHAMARSLAEDFDLRYEVKDLFREEREFDKGPGGLLLKRASGGLTLQGAFPFVRRVQPGEGALYYAKAFLYPLVAAPFVRALGTRGLLLTNVLAFCFALFLSYLELRTRMTPWVALLSVLALFGATATPVYLLWLTPEALNLGLITAGLYAWSHRRPTLSAVLLGLATYSKPTNALVALPLVLEALLDPGPSRLREAFRRGIVLVGTALLLFALNVAATGEWNYQGGERKAFEGCFPYASAEETFDRCGEWMTTQHLGPLVGREGEGDRSGTPLSRAEVAAAFRSNLVYFWVGRVGGALPYDAPVLVAALFFLAWERTRRGILALSTLLLSALAYIVIIPANWYGGGAAIGNRYFLNLLPLALFFLPKARLFLPIAVALGLFFVGPILLSPVQHSLNPGTHVTREPFISLPLELTELNDLSIFMERWRFKRPFGDTEGDRTRNWPADPKAYYLYFPDDGTRGKESYMGREGFWVKGGRSAEVVLRALEPVRQIRLTTTGGPKGDRLTVRWSGGERAFALKVGEVAEIPIPAEAGMPYYGTWVQTFRCRSEASPDVLGTFVGLALDVDRPPAD